MYGVAMLMLENEALMFVAGSDAPPATGNNGGSLGRLPFACCDGVAVVPCGVATRSSGGCMRGVVVNRNLGPLDIGTPFCDNGDGLGDAAEPGIESDRAGDRELVTRDARLGTVWTAGRERGAGACGRLDADIASS